MHYKTTVMELLQDDYPTLLDVLHENQTFLRAANQYALFLSHHHRSWINRLRERTPGADAVELARDAAELAIADLREDISCTGPTLDHADDEPVSLDAAMAMIRRPSRKDTGIAPVRRSSDLRADLPASSPLEPLGLDLDRRDRSPRPVNQSFGSG